MSICVFFSLFGYCFIFRLFVLVSFSSCLVYCLCMFSCVYSFGVLYYWCYGSLPHNEDIVAFRLGVECHALAF